MAETNEPLCLFTAKCNIACRNYLIRFVNYLIIESYRDTADKVDHVNDIKAGCRYIGIYRYAEVFLNCIYNALDRSNGLIAPCIDTVELAGRIACVVRKRGITGDLKDIQLSACNIELTNPVNVGIVLLLVKAKEKNGILSLNKLRKVKTVAVVGCDHIRVDIKVLSRLLKRAFNIYKGFPALKNML